MKQKRYTICVEIVEIDEAGYTTGVVGFEDCTIATTDLRALESIALATTGFAWKQINKNIPSEFISDSCLAEVSHG